MALTHMVGCGYSLSAHWDTIVRSTWALIMIFPEEPAWWPTQDTLLCRHVPDPKYFIAHGSGLDGGSLLLVR